MNNHIEQLAVEAAESVVGEYCDMTLQTEDDNGNKIVVPANFIEKFAELIVREAATLAYDGPNGILEHFGVE